VIDAHAKRWYLDVPNCPFASNLSLTDTLESGFQGATESMRLVRFFSSAEVSSRGAFVDAQAFLAETKDKRRVFLGARGSSSMFDMLSNLNTARTRWEPVEDKERGNAGFCACLDAFCPKGKVRKGGGGGGGGKRM